MTGVAQVRGPRLGDSASLWNFTPSPGWTKEQVAILRLALMHYGVGRWVQILDAGLLPGKLIQQLNGQTQRLIGQQSLAAYTGLHVDIDRIRADNENNKHALRKSGLIIWEGPNPTKQMRADWQRKAQIKYGLTPEQRLQAASELEEIAARTNRESHNILPLVDLMGMPVDNLSKEQKIEMLKRLRRKLQSLSSSLDAPVAAIGTELPGKEVGDNNAAHDGESVSQARQQNARKSRKPPRAPRKTARQDSDEMPACKRKSKRKRTARMDVDELDDDTDEADQRDIADAKQASKDADIEQLQAMGFSEEKAVEAMEECGDNFDLALDWLISNCV